MTAYEFEKGYEALGDYFGTRANERRKAVWWKRVQDLPGRPWLAAIDDWIEGETRMPSIRQIKSLAYGHMSPEDRGEAWNEPEIDDALFRFNRDAFGYLSRWMSGEFSRDSFMGFLLMAARKHGIEHRVPWQEFKQLGIDLPWEVQS